MKKNTKLIMTRKKKSQRPKDKPSSYQTGNVSIGDNDYAALEGLVKGIKK